jgi:hypothetical protein
MNAHQMPVPQQAQPPRQAQPEEHDDEPRRTPAHHARALPTWRPSLSTTARDAAVRLRRAWTWLRAWVLPIAGPLLLASISAALGFFVGALFAQHTG